MCHLKSQVLCCVLAGLMAVDPNLVQWRLLAAEQSAAAQAALRQRERQAAEMERRLRPLEAAQVEIPRDTFDAKAIVDKVGRDPKTLFAWVRDQTYWVPYQGSLRGPTGVLMDRLGNSLDRALLLAELLRLAGHEARLAKAEFAEDQAKEFLAKVRPVPKDMAAAAPARETVLKVIDKYAAEFKVDRDALRANLDRDWQESLKLKDELSRRLANQVPRLAQAVGKARANANKPAALQAIRDHWWVEWRAQGAWTALDTLLPESVPGQVAGQAKATTVIEPKDGKLALDGKLWHEVRVRVVVEQWQGGKLKQQTVLEHAVRPGQLFSDRISLRHLPLAWPDDPDLFGKSERARLKKVVLDGHEWLPILSVGSSHVGQTSFSDTGDVNRQAAQVFAGGLGKAAKGLDPFKAFPRPGAKAPAKETSQLTAEWIEYDLIVPGQPLRTMRRQVFDLLGPAARAEKNVPEPVITQEQRLVRGLNLLGESEILIVASQLSPDFVDHLIATRRLANKKVYPELLRKGDQATSKELRDLLTKFTPLPGNLHSLALIRSQWGKSARSLFLDQPNVMTMHTRLHLNPAGGIVIERGLDIIHNDMAVRPGSEADPFLARLEQGILDTNIEAVLLAGRGPIENTAELFHESNGGQPWLTIRREADVDEQAGRLPKDVRARIRQDLASGYVVIVPSSGVARDGRTQFGWWRLNPATGDILGMGERGWGQTTSEVALTVTVIMGIALIGLAIYNHEEAWSIGKSIYNFISGSGS